MYEKILTPRTQPVVTPERLSTFGRFDLPDPSSDEYALMELFIEAATDECETTAAQACLNEQVLLTFDSFPGQQDPRTEYIDLSYASTFWWWHGHRNHDSIELVRRPVLVPSSSPLTDEVTVTYNAPDGTTQTLNPASYTVFADKITLNVGYHWPPTDRRQDCVQVTYWAGHGDDPTGVPARLQLAVLYLANHFAQVRQVVSVEPTSEVGMTLCRMLGSYRSMRIPT
jgi:hypothetical protein